MTNYSHSDPKTNKQNVIEIEFRNEKDKKRFLKLCAEHLVDSINFDWFDRQTTTIIFTEDVEKQFTPEFDILSARDICLPVGEN